MYIEEKTKDWIPESNNYRSITLTNTNGKLVALGHICKDLKEVDAVIDRSYSLIQKSIINSNNKFVKQGIIGTFENRNELRGIAKIIFRKA